MSAFKEKDTLASLAAGLGRPMDIGTAVMPDLLENDDQYRAIVDAEFNCVVPEHHMKWNPMCSRDGLYDFAPVDLIVDWARSRGKKVKAHALLWQVTTPAWALNTEPDKLREHIRRHIYTTASHFRGRVKSWDVVNEALAPDSSLAQTEIFKKLGVGIYEDAFRWARLADPDAKLIYNDNKVEACMSAKFSPKYYCTTHAHKSDAMFELVKGMVERGVPIDGVGVQAHFDASGTGVKRPPHPHSISANIKRYGELGLTVNISEMDVRTSKLDLLGKEQREAAQAEIYGDTLRVALQEPAFEGLTLWGFTDKHTWVKDFYYDDSPLPWDMQMKRKPVVYGALSAAFRDAAAGATPVPLDSENWGQSWQVDEPADGDDQISASAAPDWQVDA